MFSLKSPESAGLPSAALVALIDRLESEGHEPHSLMILRGDQLLAEGWWTPYRRDRVHRLYSLSKSFASTAAGLAIAEGRLKLNDRVVDFFPDLTPEDPSENLKAMRVRDLLTMTCGQDSDDRSDLLAEPDGVWMRAFLKRPVPYAPGTHFLYNSSATYAVSAILQRVTGESLIEYLRPRLLDPLGIKKARWERDPNGICVGGWGLYITTESIARFGQMLLQKGQWQGKQLVPADWISEATSAQVDNSRNVEPDWRQGYGYQFWKGRYGFRGDGAFGQFCLVLPDRDLVVAITASSNDLQGVLSAVWDEVLAHLGDEPLPENPAALQTLRARTEGLAIPVPAGTSAPMPLPNGLSIDHQSVVVEANGQTLRMGTEDWIENETGIDPNVEGLVAAFAAWQPDGTLLARFQSVEATESSLATFRSEEASFVTRGTWGPTSGKVTFGKDS